MHIKVIRADDILSLNDKIKIFEYSLEEDGENYDIINVKVSQYVSTMSRCNTTDGYVKKYTYEYMAVIFYESEEI